MKKAILIFIAFFFILCLVGCGAKNKNINTIADSSKNVVEHIIKSKPECKDVGSVCIEQIDVVNKVCQQEILNEKEHSWRRGFSSGIVSLFVLLFGLAIVIKRFKK